MKKIFLFMIAIATLGSCQKDYEVEYTETYEMAREWYVKPYDGVVTVDIYRKVVTFNSAENSSSLLWIDATKMPLPNPFKVKAGIDYSAKTFKAGDFTDVLAGGNDITIIEGKVLLDKGKSKTGVTTDSLYIKFKYVGDPKEYVIGGHARTGFLEDEY